MWVGHVAKYQTAAFIRTAFQKQRILAVKSEQRGKNVLARHFSAEKNREQIRKATTGNLHDSPNKKSDASTAAPASPSAATKAAKQDVGAATSAGATAGVDKEPLRYPGDGKPDDGGDSCRAQHCGCLASP